MCQMRDARCVRRNAGAGAEAGVALRVQCNQQQQQQGLLWRLKAPGTHVGPKTWAVWTSRDDALTDRHALVQELPLAIPSEDYATLCEGNVGTMWAST